MSISQQSQPNEAVSPDMGELYELLQWMPEKSQWKKPFLFSFPLRKVAQVKKIVCYEIQLSTCCTFSLGLVARDILTGITETGRGKQTLEDDERQIRQNTETKAKKKKG